MARIPGIPTLDPVPQPYMSPAEAGGAGNAIAQLGQTSEGIALEGLQLDAHIRKAQGQVDRQAASNDLDAEFANLQADLSKTTNSRDVEDVLKSHQDNLNSISHRWSNSPDAIQIQMMAESLRPGMQQHATVRRVDLMGKEWEANTTIQLQKLLPEYVTAIRNGDTAQSKAVMDHLNSIYDEAIHNGLKTGADKQIALNGFQIATRKDLNEAAITSANANERQQAINQLAKGEKGPLDVTDMTPGEKSALLTHAREIDQRLNNLSEAQKLNHVLNNMTNVFAAPEYKDNFEAQEKALGDGDFLKKIGAVAEDGSPDRVLAEKLSADVERKRAYWKQEQDDRDEKALEQYSPMIYEHKLSLPQIEGLQGHMSARAVANLKTQFFQEQAREREAWRMDRSMEIAERQDRERQVAESSANRAAEITLEIAAGKVYEPLDIRTMPDLLPRDKQQLIQDIHAGGVIQNPYVKDGLKKFAELPLQPSLQSELARIFMEETKSGDLRGGQITQLADKLVEQGKKRHAADWIESTFRNLQPSARSGFMQPRLNEILTRSRQPVGAPPPALPAVGDVVDGWKYKGGERGDPSNWEQVKK